MLQVMLCGAADTERVRNEFAEVVSQIGGEAWHYLTGQVLHVNSSGASWEANSRATVQAADVCVFVIQEQYGELTWEVELDEAMNRGKPFLVLCLRNTYQTYLTLRTSLADLNAVVDQSQRSLIETLRMMESELELTVVPFEHGYFRDVLRRQLSTLFGLALQTLAVRNERAAVAKVLADPEALSPRELITAREIAIDELEEKTIRKRAVLALVRRNAADEEVVVSLLNSSEQGIQRLAFGNLAELGRSIVFDAELLEQCVSVANGSDDVGIARRLIPSILRIDLVSGLVALDALELHESGLRRRLASAIEDFEDEIVAAGAAREAHNLLTKCLVEGTDADWKSRCREVASRLDRVS